MTGYTDVMAINSTAVEGKISLKKHERKSLNEVQCKLFASVQAGLFKIELPEKNININLRLQDVLAVITASNKAYLEQNADGTNPLVKE